MDFKGKTVLITGAATGIGRATATLFAQSGAQVAVVDINTEKMSVLEQELCEYRDNLMLIECDVSDEQGAVAAVEKVYERFGKIDILVNNAALFRCWAAFGEIPLDEWKRYFEVNVFGTVNFTKAVLQKMIANNYGRIINTASVAGVYGNANMSHYSASKGAVIAFTKALAKEVADKGITVNAVSPGSVSPAENPDMDYTEPSELAFMGRTGSDRENAELICFLASDRAAYISGQNIQIDGCRRKQ